MTQHVAKGRAAKAARQKSAKERLLAAADLLASGGASILTGPRPSESKETDMQST